MTHPKYPKPEGDERALIESHMEFCRDMLVHKVEGLSDELGRKRLGKTMTSVLGVLKHLIDVEKWWFQLGMAGMECEFTSSPEDPDGDFKVGPHETAQGLLEQYKESCQRSREACAKFKLDDLSAKERRDGSRPTLRWIYLHMIEETARHNGQLDIYRELLDGAVDSDG